MYRLLSYLLTFLYVLLLVRLVIKFILGNPNFQQHVLNNSVDREQLTTNGEVVKSIGVVGILKSPPLA